jgi:mannosyl-3-phosphoglycerate synthase
MRIEAMRSFEHLGSVRIQGVRRVVELDSGTKPMPGARESTETQRIEREAIEAIERKMAIVLPTMNEDLKLFEGVLSGIPHDCTIIVVSNSQRQEIDTFKIEQDILARFCQATQRRALIVHQKDPSIAQAIEQAGYTELLDDEGFIRSGKSEGMILGILLAKLLEKEYVGFIDTDNFIPGAAWEYAKHYALGFTLAQSPFSMVRILWRYKPKITTDIYFKKWGRVSEVTNRHINHFLSTKGRFETEIIKTANAGEHAMSMELAMRLTYATGYGIETQELVSIFEQFGGILPVSDKTATEKGVDIIQTETVNPHLHEDRGDSDHLLQDMLLPSLSAIYHSPACEPSTRKMIIEQLRTMSCLRNDEEEPMPVQRLIPPPIKADMSILMEAMNRHMAKIAVPDDWVQEGRGAPRVTSGTTRKIVYTDLDGTLLHPVSYSYTAALEALRSLQSLKIPTVFCSAKTRSEQLVYRQELEVTDPFIVENGGAILIPKDYFRFPFTYDRVLGDYYLIELGVPYAEIRQRLKLAEEEAGREILSFGDMTVEEVARRTDLNLKMAQLAKEREYSETLILPGTRREVEVMLDFIRKQGLHVVFGGRFFEANQGADKGKAVQILNELFKLNYGQIETFGIGDTENDWPMLDRVDHPLLVQNGQRRWNKTSAGRVLRVKGVGPEGFARAVSELILPPVYPVSDKI